MAARVTFRSDNTFWASLMYVPIVLYKKSASLPSAAKILYVVFSIVLFLPSENALSAFDESATNK